MIPDVGIYRIEGGEFVLKAAYSPKSVSWECKYVETGVCQIVFDKDAEIVSTVTVNTFASFKPKDGLWFRPIMYIHSVKITDTEVYAYGYEAKELLNKKVLISQTANGTVNIADAITDVVEEYGAYTWLDTDATEVWNMGTANLDGLEYTTVYEYIKACCKLKGFGINLGMSLTLPRKGVLTIYGQTEPDNPIRLATALGNITETGYTESYKSYATRVYALGSDGIMEYADAELVYDDEVYEYLLDLRTDFPKDDNMSEADYRAALITRARMSLGQRQLSTKVDVKDVDLSDLGADFKLGTQVQVIIPELIVSEDTVTKLFTGLKYTAENGTLKTTITLD